MTYKKIRFIYPMLFIITAIMLLIIERNPYQNVGLNVQKSRSFNYGWSRVDTNQPILLEEKNDCDINQPFSIYRNLPKQIYSGECLLLRSMHSYLEVYIDDICIYRYGDSQSPFILSPGNAWHMIPLKQEFSNRKITISTTTNIEKYSGRISYIDITDRASGLLRIIQKNLVGIIASIMILTIGCIMFIIWLVCFRFVNVKKLLHLSFFSILLFIWSIGETTILQFLFGNMQIISFISFEFIILMQVPMMLFFSYDENHEVKSRFVKYMLIPMINSIICNGLLLFCKVDLSESVIVTHVCLLLCTMVSIYSIYRERCLSKGKSSLNLKSWGIDTWGFAFISVMAMFDMIRYYTSFDSDSAIFSRFGILIYIFTLGFQTIQLSISKLIEGQKNLIYKHLAYYDALTKVYNRMAYEERIQQLNSELNCNMNVSVVAIDVNNLKYINDTYGHAQGDQYIVKCANFCTEHFGNIADCYRIGGDEFVLISKPGTSEKLIQCAHRMEEEQLNKDHMRINFSFGFALFDYTRDTSIENLVIRADSNMYEQKMRNRSNS